MNRFAQHEDSERLSAYLDDELGWDEARAVKSHLEVCPSCRHRFDGMRRVTHQLAAVERSAPPPWLAQRVRGEVVRVANNPTPWDRIRRALGALQLQSPLSSAFSMVLGFAVLVVLLAHDVDRVERVEPPVEPTIQLARPIVTVTEGDEVGNTIVTTSQVAGRIFLREEEGGIWIEAGLIGSEPETRVNAASPRGRALLARYEGLGDLLADGSRVVLRDRTKTLELWASS